MSVDNVELADVRGLLVIIMAGVFYCFSWIQYG